MYYSTCGLHTVDAAEDHSSHCLFIRKIEDNVNHVDGLLAVCLRLRQINHIRTNMVIGYPRLRPPSVSSPSLSLSATFQPICI